MAFVIGFLLGLAIGLLLTHFAAPYVDKAEAEPEVLLADVEADASKVEADVKQDVAKL